MNRKYRYCIALFPKIIYLNVVVKIYNVAIKKVNKPYTNLNTSIKI